MTETLSEFLNMVELRGHSWCYVDIRGANGFSVPPNDAVLFHAVLRGTARIGGVSGGALDLQAGDVAIILSGEAHAVRNEAGSIVRTLDFLRSEQMVDAPATITIGEPGAVATRLLCGRMSVSWLRGLRRTAIPPVVRLGPDSMGLLTSVIKTDALQIAGVGAGAAAMLTRLASLMLVSGLRDHAQSLLGFKASARDPITQALHLISADPAAPWSVEGLAQKVGMGRSSFAARFTAEVGRAPMEVVIDQRMHYAAELLREGDLKIIEISARAGYGSEGAFSRRFTRHFGLSPSQVRRNAQQGETTEPAISPWQMLMAGGGRLPDKSAPIDARRPLRAAVSLTKFPR